MREFIYRAETISDVNQLQLLGLYTTEFQNAARHIYESFGFIHHSEPTLRKFIL